MTGLWRGPPGRGAAVQEHHFDSDAGLRAA